MTPNCERRASSTVAPQSLAADEQRVRRRAVRGLRRPGAPARPAPTPRRGSPGLAAGPGRRADARARSRRPSPSWPSSGPTSPPASRRGAEGEPNSAGPTRPRRAGDVLPGAVQLERVPVRRLTESTETGAEPMPHDRDADLDAAPLPGQQGMSLGSLALAWLLHAGRAAWRRPGASRPRAAGLRPQAQGARRRRPGPGDDLAVHAGRAQPPRPVRPQARAPRSATARPSPATSSTTTPARPAPSSSPAPGSSASTAQCGMELSELLPGLGGGRRRRSRWSARCRPA